MHQIAFQSPTWYNALTLTERITSLRTGQLARLRVEVNTALAERRLQRWQSQPPFAMRSTFTQRLAMEDISEDEFFYLLGEPIQAVCDRFPIPPMWLAELAEAFARPCSPHSFLLLERLRGHDKGGFLDAIEPLISQGRELVHKGVETLRLMYSELPFDLARVEKLIFANLLWPLVGMLDRTMVLELHVARLQGLLQGDSPEERFQSFLQRLRQRDIALAILQEYPVLAHQLVRHIHQWVTCSLEFLQRLCADWEMIRATFSPRHNPGELEQVHGGAGDCHRGGRSVLIARFSSGFQVVYKPRPLALDVHFQGLLTWLNDRGDHPSFRTLKILDRGSYGWVEFVAAQGCASVTEVRRFYERQGGYLALLYALAAADFHSENLIAAGEHPVLVDLEALFHPRVDGMDLTQADQLASHTLNDSVLGTGLLPQRVWANAKSEGIDISGLGAVASQLTPYDVPQWEGVGTDEIRLIRTRIMMPGSQNRPTLNGAEVEVFIYAEAILAGFTTIYRLLLQYRDNLLADDSPLARFAEDEVRVILRPTQTYSVLLRESFHPDVLRNALDRDRLFDQLWVEVENRPYLAKVMLAERIDLHQGDVPIFTTHPNSRDLWSSSGERITDFLEEPGMAVVQRRMLQMSEDDLAKQLWFIRASLTSLATGGERARWRTFCLTEPQSVASHDRLLAAARAVGDRLQVLALRGEQNVSWIGLTLIDERRWSLVPLGLDLYDGLPGVALFLAYLGAMTSDEGYTILARAALSTIRSQVERRRPSITSIGGFDGWGGVIYTLMHLATLWDEPSLLAEAGALVELVPDLIEKDEQLDLIAGAAGCIGSLISLYRCAPSDRTLDVAIRCGDHLMTRAQPMAHGSGWRTKFGGAKPLTGFSHGAAGMAWALLELTALTGEERFRKTALEAMAYERSLFRPEVGNWPDLRDFATTLQVDTVNQFSYMTAWCHGAPGIGLARLRSLPRLDDTDIRLEIHAALKTTLAHGFGGNHSLCHGDLGNLELLLQASEILDDPQWGYQVQRLAAIILESIGQHSWLCGIPLRVESPGLMTGLAGIGYGLLRLAEPTRVPSVLVLDPPLLQA